MSVSLSKHASRSDVLYFSGIILWLQKQTWMSNNGLVTLVAEALCEFWPSTCSTYFLFGFLVMAFVQLRNHMHVKFVLIIILTSCCPSLLLSVSHVFFTCTTAGHEYYHMCSVLKRRVSPCAA